MSTAWVLLLGMVPLLSGAVGGAEAAQPRLRRGLQFIRHHRLRSLHTTASSPLTVNGSISAAANHTATTAANHTATKPPARLQPHEWDRWLSHNIKKWSGTLEDLEEEKCPEWIGEYANKHAQLLKESREKPRFLMYLCKPSLFYYVNDMRNCSGTGDRVKAMEHTYQLAAEAGRPLLLSWEHPLPLETFFVPAGPIDWREKEEYSLPDIMSNDTARYIWNTHSSHKTDHDDIASKAYLTASEPLLAVVTTSQGTDMPGLPIGPRASLERSCIFNALFKASDELEHRVKLAREHLFGDSSKEYLAIHLRLGGLEGEEEAVQRFDPFKGLLAALEGAHILAQANNLTGPILLLTDNAQLREMVANGMFGPGVIGPSTLAHHIAKVRGGGRSMEEELNIHMPTFVEMGLLAQAKCFIYSHSGFSSTAVEWGRPKCRVNVNELISALDRRPFEAMAHHHKVT